MKLSDQKINKLRAKSSQKQAKWEKTRQDARKIFSGKGPSPWSATESTFEDHRPSIWTILDGQIGNLGHSFACGENNQTPKRPRWRIYPFNHYIHSQR